MFSIRPHNVFFLISLAFSVSATPLPPVEPFPEVIPGPGLPSLESLNLTSTELYTMELPNDETAKLPAHESPCGGTHLKAPVKGVVACMNYLYKLESTNCAVGAWFDAGNYNMGVTEMCRAGNAHITGSGQRSPTNSYCSNVARTVHYIIDRCTDEQGLSGGAWSVDENKAFTVAAVNLETW
ncbi:unnamed protein product [Periconia digitata]|uniref:Uncharacterized protein n=1 Tax=Periconia digitata TaxID=1303443 RepID=A0A9W4UR59_9PLEO|nr:unnamed protein product [Periconia digitata]